MAYKITYISDSMWFNDLSQKLLQIIWSGAYRLSQRNVKEFLRLNLKRWYLHLVHLPKIQPSLLGHFSRLDAKECYRSCPWYLLQLHFYKGAWRYQCNLPSRIYQISKFTKTSPIHWGKFKKNYPNLQTDVMGFGQNHLLNWHFYLWISNLECFWCYLSKWHKIRFKDIVFLYFYSNFSITLGYSFVKWSFYIDSIVKRKLIQLIKTHYFTLTGHQVGELKGKWFSKNKNYRNFHW